MSGKFQDQHAASISRIAASADILAERVTVEDEVQIACVDRLGDAMNALHGIPRTCMKVTAQVEYAAMLVDRFTALQKSQEQQRKVQS